jgi:hypothetical protein
VKAVTAPAIDPTSRNIAVADLSGDPQFSMKILA